MGLSTVDANALLANRFGGVSWPAPSSYDVGLSSTPPNDDGTNVTEPADPAYARVPLSNVAGSWDYTTDRLVTTAVAVTFADADEDWEDIGYWCLFDPGDDHLVEFGRFAGSATVPAGTAARIEAGGINIRVPASTITL